MRLVCEVPRRKYLLLLICILLAGASTLAGAKEMDKSYMRENNTVTLKIEDSGKEVILKKGDILQIELRTFGTAGYTWQFVDLDKEYLEIVSKKITPLSDRTGAPTLCTWHLRAMKTGVTKVAMSNYRVWEGKGKAVGEFLITVRIE